MKRVYEVLLKKHLASNRQMVFLSGPRQVGKTTTSLEASLESPLHPIDSAETQSFRAGFPRCR